MSAPSATARGALVGIATVVAERAVAFLVVLVLARTLAPETFGRYGYVLAGMTLVQVIADQGIEVAAVAAMSASAAPVRDLLGAAFLLRILVWCLVALPVGGLVLPALASGDDPGQLMAAGLAASGLVLAGGSISMRGVLRARGAMGAMAGVALADAVLGACAVIAVARATGDVAGLFAARALASLVVTAAAIAFGPYRPAIAGGWRAIRQLMGVAVPLGGNAVLIGLHTRAGHLVAMSLAGPAVVGLLGVAARVTEVLGVLPEGALLAVFPRMAADASRAPAVAAVAARRVGALVLALVVVLAIAADPIARLLFGDAYAGAGPAIAILAWIALLAVTGGVALHAIVARGAERLLVPANLVAAAVGLVLQVLLIRRLGLAGAAIATVATAAIGQVALVVPATTRAVMVPVWRAVLPLAGLAAGAVLVGRWVSPTLRGAVAMACAYVGLAMWLRLVDREDWRIVRHALRRPRIDA